MQRLLRLLADPTRVRILAALDGEELAVNEIADVLGVSQSRVSNHLRLLREAGALHDRREGQWTFYRSALTEEEQPRALWSAVRAGLAKDPALRADAARRRAALERRRRRSRDHFGGDGHGNQLERETLREEILSALAPEGLTVVDAGCGDGYLTEVLAERFDKVLAFDHSPERLQAARARVPADNVVFEQAEVDDLPLPAGSCHAVFFSMVLHHVPQVAAALREAARILRAGGRIVVAELAPHDEESMRRQGGDLRLGIDSEELGRMLEQAGFHSIRALPARDRVRAGRGKQLDIFLATAVRSNARRRGSSRKKKETNGRTP